jgi:hypothetical protein
MEKNFKEKRFEDVDRLDLAQVRDRRWADVNMVMKLWAPEKA